MMEGYGMGKMNHRNRENDSNSGEIEVEPQGGHDDNHHQNDQNQMQQMKFGDESRSLYVGHLPDACIYYDLCKAAHDFGPLELVRLVPRKKCAFLNFLEKRDAKAMIERYAESTLPHPEESENESQVLRILGKAVRLSWSETNSLPEDIYREVSQNNASRNLFVFYGNCIRHHPSSSNERFDNFENPPPVITTAELAEKFRIFGHIENIVIKPKKHIAFVNMTSISAAVAAFKASEAADDQEWEHGMHPNPSENGVNTGGQKQVQGLLLRGARLVVKYSTEEKSRENYAHERNDPRNQPFSYNSQYINPQAQVQSRIASAEDSQLPPGWLASVDEMSGCKYYYNTAKRITQWEHPVTGKPAPPMRAHPNSGFDAQSYQQNGNGSELLRQNSIHSNMGLQPSRAVILQGLAPTVDYAKLCTLGRQYGMIESVRLHPDKMMAFINYLDTSSANNLFDYAATNPIVLDGQQVRLGWARDVPIKPYLYEAIVQDGANRSIYLRDVPDDLTENEVISVFSELCNSEIESIILRPEGKPCGFVNFIDIISAKKVVDATKKSQGFLDINGRRIHISYVNTRRQSVISSKSGGKGPSGVMQKGIGRSGKTVYGPASGQCRSVIISGFPLDTKLKDVAQLGNQFGEIESLHLNPEKNHAFINFLLPEAATKFMGASRGNELRIKDVPVRVGFGKSVTIRNDVASAIQEQNACRSVYVGGIPMDAENWESILHDMTLQQVKENEIESIFVHRDKECAFINLSSILGAKKVVNAYRGTDIHGYKLFFSYAKATPQL